MNTPQIEATPKKEHRGLKRLGIAILIAIVFLYLVSIISTYGFEQGVKESLVAANRETTGQDVTVDDVKVDIYKGTTDIYRFKIFNPPGFISPYAIAVGEATMVATVSPDQTNPNMIFKTVELKDVNINYELNIKKDVNLYKIIDTLTKTLAPKPNFSPLSIFQNRTTTIAPADRLKYTGLEFYLEKVIIQKPTINIYSNGILVKSQDMKDIVLTYGNLKQPTNYGYVLLASSLQAIDQIDKTIRK